MDSTRSRHKFRAAWSDELYKYINRVNTNKAGDCTDKRSRQCNYSRARLQAQITSFHLTINRTQGLQIYEAFARSSLRTEGLGDG